MSDVEELFLEHLECPVCFEFYEEPKVFTNCGHTVCASCIGGILAATPGNKKTISCPQCRVQSAVPAGGLQTNYVVAGIAEKVKLAHARGPCAVCNKRTSEDHFYK
ncbi:hypothetical protein AAVH_08769 [Aphelenchoides avenae]|nr:hypothetical protein AAVH_08769 [Aphelenchus avenae]